METKLFAVNPSDVELRRRGKVKAAGPQPDIELQIRVSNAVRYHTVWGWTKREAFESAGIGKNRLNTALDDVAAGGNGIVKPGPKPLLTNEILQEVKQDLTLKSMNFKSVRVKERGEYTLMKMIYTAIQRKQTNAIARLRRWQWHNYYGNELHTGLTVNVVSLI